MWFEMLMDDIIKVVFIFLSTYIVWCLFSDLTLWNFQVDKLIHPFYKHRNGNVCDSSNSNIASLKVYDETHKVLETLTNQQNTDVKLGIASRIKDIAGAYQLLHLLQIEHHFRFKQIYPGKKIAHLFHLHYRSGIHFNDILFFDDDVRNVRDLKMIGVPTYQVIDGITMEQLNDALELFSNKYGHYYT